MSDQISDETSAPASDNMTTGPAPTGAAATSIPPAAPPLRDRSGALVAVGVIQIILGAGSALMLAFATLGVLLAGAMTRVNPQLEGTISARTLVPSILTYGLAAVFFIWTGLATIRARRWARSIMHAVSWLWLILGALVTVGFGVVIGTGAFGEAMRRSMAAQGTPMPPGFDAVMQTIMWITLVFLAALFVGLPLFFLLFYRAPSVRATFARRDPTLPWTERLPLPALVLVVMLIHAAVFFLLNGWAMWAVPFFGHFFTGAAGVAVNTLFGAVYAWLAWEVAQRRRRGWLGTIGASALLSIGHIDTLWGMTVAEYARASGLPPAQIRAMEQYDFYGQYGFVAVLLVWLVPFFAYLVWVGRYFPRSTGSAASAPQNPSDAMNPPKPTDPSDPSDPSDLANPPA